MDVLDALQQDFTAYRRAHRRGAYPKPLRQRAVRDLSPEQLLQLAARLGLTAAQVERWSGLVRPAAETSGFIEVSARPTVPAGQGSPPATGCTLEVNTRSGATLTIRGNVSPGLLEALVQALQRAAT